MDARGYRGHFEHICFSPEEGKLRYGQRDSVGLENRGRDNDKQLWLFLHV